MENKQLFIEGQSNSNSVGITLHFNDKTGLQLGGLRSKVWRVSWDEIGKALCGSEYNKFESETLNKGEKS